MLIRVNAKSDFIKNWSGQITRAEYPIRWCSCVPNEVLDKSSKI
jgi:hypothetical protein